MRCGRARRLDVDDRSSVAALDRSDLGVADQTHAVGLECALDDERGVGVLPGENVRGALDERDLRAEAGERLRHLAADRPGADHDQTTGQLGQPEEGLVGEVADLVETGDGWRGGARSGGDDGGARR